MNTRQDLAHRLRQCMEETGDTSATLAAAFSIRPQSVDSWLRTGRIAKSRLLGLAKRYGRPISWWLGSDDGDDEAMLSKDERELLAAYRELQEPLRQVARQTVKSLRNAGLTALQSTSVPAAPPNRPKPTE